MPHLRHVIVLAIVEVMAGVPTDVLIGVRPISSRSGIGRRVTCSGEVMEADLHAVRDIDPGDL